MGMGALSMERWAILLFSVYALASLICIFHEVKRVRKERLMMTKIRNSEFYAKLYAMVRHARRFDLDQVRVERSRIVFTGVHPAGMICEFDLAGSSSRILSNNRTRVLAEVLGEDIPELKTYRYALRRYAITRPNGKKDYGYVYTIRSAYKTQLIYARKYSTTK